MVTKIGQLAQELGRLNPWWRDQAWDALDPDLRDARNTGIDYRSGVLDNLEPGGLYILRGPRRVGKTVAVKQQVIELIRSGRPPTSIVRLAVDGWSAKDLRTIVQNTALPPVAGPHQRTWLIDEVSAVTGAWDQQLKWLRDNDPGFRSATVVITGSNATALTEAAGTLSGRRGPHDRLDRTLLPIGFRTFCEILRPGSLPPTATLALSELTSAAAHDTFMTCVPWIDELTRLWEIYLNYGGFPRAVAAAAHGEAIPASFVEDVFNIIAGDAFRHSKLGITSEMALIERLWAGMASPANLSNIGNDVGVRHDVVARHVGYLRDSYPGSAAGGDMGAGFGGVTWEDAAGAAGVRVPTGA